ncbi:homeobox protein MSX-1 [Galleria mellonella]|uniref:Homeobox protein MSX-1 n=1 Tax=Galleria mellonella TaxID=7137 RepID=A0A6J1X483_GALME|nr:homeobox protein MSX-1 [Galleria mellonella]
MDVPPVMSGAKCSNSDFSIERILSEDPRHRTVEQSETPSWLCCTRYKPPRLPRSVNSNACRGRRSGRHARVPFTATQAAALEAAYARAPYLAPPALRALAAALQLRDDRIKIWFQNRRARERREKSAIIPPPRDATLAPTTQRITFTPDTWITYPNTGLLTLSNGHYVIDNSLTTVDHNLPVDTETPHDLIENSLPVTIFQPHSAEETTDEERSDTPLDVENIE